MRMLHQPMSIFLDDLKHSYTAGVRARMMTDMKVNSPFIVACLVSCR